MSEIKQESAADENDDVISIAAAHEWTLDTSNSSSINKNEGQNESNSKIALLEVLHFVKLIFSKLSLKRRIQETYNEKY
jgi:hypothetical protein